MISHKKTKEKYQEISTSEMEEKLLMVNKIMRSIWTGAIGFGLVNIPVKFYSAAQGSELDLDMLDKKRFFQYSFSKPSIQ